MTQFIPINSTTFKIVHEKDRESTVGDSKSSSFLPCIEIKPWSGDVLRFSYESIIGTSNLTDIDRLEYTDSDYTFTFTDIETDKDELFASLSVPGIKFKMLLSSKPKADLDGFVRFDFKIEGHDELVFLSQDPLTQEEIDLGCEQPEFAIDSIAVYHQSKKNNEFKTGKICHIYRPWIKDSLGNFTWGKWEWDLDANRITKVFPGSAFRFVGAKWWEVDATFGNTAQGALEYVANGNVFLADFDITAGAAGGTITGLGAYVHNISGSPLSMEHGCYDNDAGDPGDLMAADVTEVYAGSFDGLREVSYAGGVMGSEGDNIFPGVRFIYNSVKIYYDNSGGSTVYDIGVDWPDPWLKASDARNSWKLSLWIVYTAAAGGSIPLLVGGGMGQTMGSNCNLMTG